MLATVNNLLQPLNVIVLQPYKHYHARAVEADTQIACGDFNKCEFLNQIHSIHYRLLNQPLFNLPFRVQALSSTILRLSLSNYERLLFLPSSLQLNLVELQRASLIESQV